MTQESLLLPRSEVSSMAPRIAAIQRAAAKLSWVLDRVITLTCAGVVLFMSVSTFAGVIYRYVLEQPLDWPEETARFGLVWLSLLAGARSLRRGQHIAISYGVARLPLAGRRWMRLLMNLVIVVFLSVFVYQSINYLEIVTPQTATATGISMVWPYLGLVVSFGVMLVIAVLEIIDAICAEMTGTSTSVAVATAEEGVELLNAVPDSHRESEINLSKEP